MKRILTFALVACPIAAMAAPGEITPMARYCPEALVDSRPLMTSALVPTTAEAVGRGHADERAEFFTVPHENLVFSKMQVQGLSACAVFPAEGNDGWTEASVNSHLELLGLVSAEQCSIEGQVIWLSSLPNLKRKGVTVGLAVSDGVVSEILAYETPELTRPSDCKSEGME